MSKSENMSEDVPEELYFQKYGEEKTRNSEALIDFVMYCSKHPNERFWQALRNWSGYSSVFGGDYIYSDKGDVKIGFVDLFSYEGGPREGFKWNEKLDPKRLPGWRDREIQET